MKKPKTVNIVHLQRGYSFDYMGVGQGRMKP